MFSTDRLHRRYDQDFLDLLTVVLCTAEVKLDATCIAFLSRLIFWVTSMVNVHLFKAITSKPNYRVFRRI
jgi:hypothetical protein